MHSIQLSLSILFRFLCVESYFRHTSVGVFGFEIGGEVSDLIISTLKDKTRSKINESM